MADNFVTDPGSGGVTFASDEDGSSVHWPLVKLVYGALDTFTLVSTSNPLPVDLRTDNLSGNLDVNLAASGITLNVSAAVTSVVAGTGATNLGKAEDAAHSNGDTGVMALAVRQDTDSSLVGASGDYAPLQVNSAGALKVEIFDGGDSHTIDGTVTANAGTGTFTVTDDGSFTLAANSGTDIGDVTINNASGASAVNIQDGGNSITVDGTVSIDTVTTSIVPGTGASHLGKAEDAAHNSGDTGVMALAVRQDTDGTLAGTTGDYAPLQVDANGALKVEIFDGGDSHTVDGTVTANAGTGTFTVTDDGSFTLAANSGVDIGDVTINNGSGAGAVNIQDGGNSITVDGAVSAAGDVAHDSADSGNPVKIGAVARTSHPSAVSDADRVNAYADDLGRLVVQPFVPRDLLTHNQITLTDTTETTLIGAGGSGVFRDLVWLFMTNTSATQVRVDIRDSTSGTVRLSIALAVSGGGANVTIPIQLTQGTANNNWTAQLSGSVSSVYITAISIDQN
jgi:hypothetical protein